MKRALKIIGYVLGCLLLLIGAFFVYVHYFIALTPPNVVDQQQQELLILADGVRRLDDNWLRQDSTGIWEMYITGKPFERGQAIGSMAEDLLDFQEKVFVDQLEKLVPNQLYQSFLLHAIKFYNRNLDDYIPLEFKEEIYGVSLYAPKEYSHLGSNYERKLSYHAAHDIGHAFQNMGFVSGCTALSTFNTKGELLLGRNFDFFVGDDFAKNKIVACIRPDSGYAFISLAWAGMIGVVSGMNEKGLAVALNAGPSDMPKGAQTPVTLIAREIIQYASTIQEALAIAQKRDVFVSENFIIASGSENRVVIIEKSPGSTVLFEGNPAQFVCSNHFLSDQHASLETNLIAQARTSSKARYNQVQEILASNPVKSVEEVANILRTTKGARGLPLGLGNELAINQLTGHHSIIFNASKKIIYIAGVPSQSGPYLKYNLNDIFSTKYEMPQRLWSEAIPASRLLNTNEFADFQRFREKKQALQNAISMNKKWTKENIDAFIALNPDHYIGYKLAGEYFEQIGDRTLAEQYFKEALDRPIPWAIDREALEDRVD